jgi:hypothetical protein
VVLHHSIEFADDSPFGPEEVDSGHHGCVMSDDACL